MSDVIEQLAADLSTDAPVDVATMFHSPAVRSAGKIVAFLGHDDRLILKLPRERAMQLMTDGTVEAVTMGERTMREWVSIALSTDRSVWLGLSREALAYVRGLEGA